MSQVRKMYRREILSIIEIPKVCLHFEVYEIREMLDEDVRIVTPMIGRFIEPDRQGAEG